MRLGDRWQAARGTVLATLPDQLPPRFGAGVEVRLNGVLRQPRAAATPACSTTVDTSPGRASSLNWPPIPSPHWEVAPRERANPTGLVGTFHRLGQCHAGSRSPQADEAVRLREAMLLGRREIMTDELSRPFQRSGHVARLRDQRSSHLAGGHDPGRLARVPEPAARMGRSAGDPRALGLPAATGWQPSAVRASVMMSVLLAAGRYSALRICSTPIRRRRLADPAP